MQMHPLLVFAGGILIGLIAPSVLYLKYFFPKRQKALLKKAVSSLERLNDEIFACFLQPSYPDTRYLFERRIHVEKNEFMQAMVALQLSRNVQKASIQKLNQLYDLMLSYAQLRWRISDHSVFLLCTKELSQLSRIISRIFTKACRAIRSGNTKLEFHYYHLPGAIERLEANYYQVLQVSAKEPLNFLLFIANLKLFCEELMDNDIEERRDS